MAQHNTSPVPAEPLINSMDLYLAEFVQGPEHYLGRVQSTWDNMTPTERLELQSVTRELAGDDIALGQEFARSQVLFAYATTQAHTAGQIALANEVSS